MIRLALATLLGASALASTAEARACRPGEAPRFSADGRPTCEAGARMRPYDPSGQRAGSRPGFIDLGNGTEVRVGGRVQMNHDSGRR